MESSSFLLTITANSNLYENCQPSTPAVWSSLKGIFAEYGIPQHIVSDHGPQFSSELFRTFTKEWSFNHATSSPRYPRSNGFKARQIHIVKSVLQKTKQDSKDPALALLCPRTTPIGPGLPSPAEILMGRRVNSNLPIKTDTPPNGHLIKSYLKQQVLSSACAHCLEELKCGLIYCGISASFL